MCTFFVVGDSWEMFLGASNIRLMIVFPPTFFSPLDPQPTSPLPSPYLYPPIQPIPTLPCNHTNPFSRNLDVFTQNKRSIQPLQTAFPPPVLFIAIGALLVGSIAFVAEQGQQVRRGEDLGFFKYGGSTVIVLFQREIGVVFD